MNTDIALYLLGLAMSALGICMVIIGFFLRVLHRKIDTSVSQDEFNEAMKSMREDHERDRRELRESILMFQSKIESQNTLLVTVATKLELLTSMRPFNQTYPGTVSK